MNEKISKTHLDNGLTILSDTMPGVRSVTVGFFFRVGSRNEPLELNGITHFIEHSVFKGTRRRTAKQIAFEQDRLGGNLDAFTTHEETGFAVKVLDEQLPAAFDLLADILTAPRFEPADLVNEQRVIIEEIKMMDDSPEELLGELFYAEFYPDHPLGLSIAGTPATVRSFDSEKTRAYHAAAFSPANLVIAAAGNIEHDRLVEMAAAIEFPTGNGVSLNGSEPPRAAAPILLESKPDLEQSHVLIATPFVDARDPRRYAADLLTNIIGGGTSSRLWQKVREDRGLAYSVGTSAALFRDCGLFSVFAGTSPEQVGELTDIVIDEMRWVVRNGVSEEELRLTKDQTRTSILLGLEDSASRSAAIANAEILHGRPIPVEETLQGIENVSTDQVAELAREFFTSEQVAFAAVGDLSSVTIDRERLSI
jgi:predicted Zn-dependent peptidase